MKEQFERTAMLLGDAAMERLQNSTVAVFGIGGVGGHAAEALARSGVGTLHLIDSDTVSPTNINRQMVALNSTIGKYKVDVAAERIIDINPDIKVITHNVFFNEDTKDQFDFSAFDYVVDAIDSVTSKILLVECATAQSGGIISSMGAGNKLDPTSFEVADIYKTSVCPLARVMRAELRKRGVKRLKVVYSKEPPVINNRVPASAPFVPSVAGLIAAGEAVRDIVKEL